MQVKAKLSLDKSMLEHTHLKEIIQKWFRAHNNKIGQNFKISIKKIRELDASFQMKCIEYILLRKFAWILKDFQDEKVIELNNYLKKAYERLIISCFFGSANTFQSFIVYIVKLSSYFLEQSFSNLMIDITLESQNFIVLYFMFLGVEMKQSTYEIIQRKYMKTPLKNIQQSVDQKQFRASKNSFLQSFMKVSNKSGPNNKLRKSQHSVHNSYQSFRKPAKESFFKEVSNDISAIIKENLHVKPLPPLHPKKIKIRELQRMKTEPNPSEDTNRNSYQRQETHHQTHQKRTYIYSNQLSNSLKSLHPDQFFFELASKKTKINRSFYDNPFKENIQSIGLVNQRKVEIDLSVYRRQTDLNKNEQRKSTEWLSIVGELKKKVIGMRCNGGEMKNAERKSENQDVVQYQECQKSCDKINSSHEIRTQLRDILETSNKIKSNDILSFTNQGFKKEPIESLKIESIQQKNEEFSNQFIKRNRYQQEKKVTKNKIRIDQNNFFIQCNARIGFIAEMQTQNLNESWNSHQIKYGKRLK